MPKKFKFGFDMKNVDWVKVSTCVLALLAVVLAIMILVKVDKSKQGFSLRGKNGNGKLGDNCLSEPGCFPDSQCCAGLDLNQFISPYGNGNCCLGVPSTDPGTDGNCSDVCDQACETDNNNIDQNCYNSCVSSCPSS
jgi:hypothetical protein